MPIDILMPALSPTMEEGTLAKWLIKPGDNVSAGDIIAEIETDKATMEVEAVDDGVVGTLKIAAGTEGVKVNSIIAILIGEDENLAPGNLPANTDKAPAEVSKANTGQADENKGEASQNLSQPAAGALPNSERAKNQPEPNSPSQPSGGKANEQKQGRVFASPLAKRLAAQFGLSLESIQGSGPRGRIIKRDVEQASAAGTGAASPSPALPAGTSPIGTSPASSLPQNLELKPDDAAILRSFEPGSYELLAHDGMRKTIAKRLSAAKRDIPHFYIQTDCRIDALLDMRAQINAGAPKSASGDAAYKISVNDLVIKAHALALKQVPKANASYTETAAVYHKYCDIGVAVAVEGGLFTPIIRRAEEKSLSAISNEMRELAQKARARKLKPHEYEGGGTAISNLGMYGIDAFSAVINPPHGTILAVGAGVKRPVVEGDQIVAGTIMSATLSVDHRVVDGTLGAELLAAFKRLIENPLTMLI